MIACRLSVCCVCWLLVLLTDIHKKNKVLGVFSNSQTRACTCFVCQHNHSETMHVWHVVFKQIAIIGNMFFEYTDQSMFPKRDMPTETEQKITLTKRFHPIISRPMRPD